MRVEKKGPETGPFCLELVPATEHTACWLEHGFIVPFSQHFQVINQIKL